MAQTSITVTFVTEDADGPDGRDLLSCDLDEDKHVEVYGEAKSRFLVGETAYIRVFRYPPDKILRYETSDGTLGVAGSGVAELTDRLTFANAKEASLGKPADSIQNVYWYGRSGGGLDLDIDKITLASEVVAVADVTYRASFQRFALTLRSIPSDVDEYPVLVFFWTE